MKIPALRRSAALVAFALAAAPLSGYAQTAPAPAPAPAPQAAPGGEDTVAQARAHFGRGVKLYEEDDFRAALIEFNRAYELAPNWAVLYNIGQSYYQLRDYANGLRILERYSREGGVQIAPDRRAQIEREMAELRGRVAHVTLTSNVEGAEVSLDDSPLGKLPLSEPALIGTGRHKLTVTKPGYTPTTKVVDIAGSDRMTIALDMSEVPHETEVAQRAPEEPPSRTPAIVVGTIGVVGVITGSVFGGLAIGSKSSLSNECNTSTKQCQPGSQSDIDSFARNTTISTIGFSVGLVGLAAATILWVLESPKSEAKPAPAGNEVKPEQAARVSPWIGLGTAGVSGSF
jgi:hypothetical protein